MSAAIAAAAPITNPTGLHARPAVKLTKLAKSFAATLRLRVGEEGRWIDAKSVARVLSLKATQGETLFIEAEGADAAEAVRSLIELVRRNFDEGSPLERQLAGQVACGGLAEGFIVLAGPPLGDGGTGPADGAPVPARERTRLEGAIARAAAEIDALKAMVDAVAAEILDFQIEFLRDSALLDPAFAAIDAGQDAGQAFRATLEAQISEYRASSDRYFAARASDLTDLRDRVLAALAPQASGPLVQEEGGIYVAEDLTPSRFLELDWSRWRGVALLAGSTASHVAILARARGVPLLVGLGARLAELPARAPVLLDAESGRLIVHPSEVARRQLQERLRARAEEAAAEARSAPAVSAAGIPMRVQINVESEAALAGLSPTACDGIGLLRTELLFHRGLPDEETQARFYARLVTWAAGNPVTVRALDAGGDKPIPGLSLPSERNPFLGVRGIRLLLAHPELFRVQLRALARAAALGPVKVMLPMITVPAELVEARRMLNEEVDALVAAGTAAALPPLGIMVEVPAVALSIARFDAAFYSIGSNDLLQYVTAASRGDAALAALYDARNPALWELIARVAAHGRAVDREVSVCGDLASDPDFIPDLLAAGVTSLSVAPAALGAVKRALAAQAR